MKVEERDVYSIYLHESCFDFLVFVQTRMVDKSLSCMHA